MSYNRLIRSNKNIIITDLCKDMGGPHRHFYYAKQKCHCKKIHTISSTLYDVQEQVEIN